MCSLSGRVPSLLLQYSMLLRRAAPQMQHCACLLRVGTQSCAAIQVATACSAGSRQATCRAQQARSALASVRETAGLAEAKVSQRGP